MDRSGCGVGRLNIITPQEGSMLELQSLCVCVCVCKHVSNLHRPAFTSHSQIFTPVQLPLGKRKLWLVHSKCVTYVSACCVYVSMCERAVCACVCVQGGRTGDPSGTTLTNNGSFIPAKRLTGLSVLQQPHKHRARQETHGPTCTHADTRVPRLIRGIQQGSVFS